MPDPKPLLPESDQTTTDEKTPSGRPERALTQEGLAHVLLRFLGVVLVARAIIVGVGTAEQLLVLWNSYGLDFGVRQYHWEYLVGPGAELMIGIYFLVGGQWVYEKVLTPIFRSSPADAPQETEEDGLDDRQGKDNN
jgi:hypothetical protein